MKELIKISDREGRKVVSARELYEKLGFNKTQWKRWYEKNIIKNPYAAENQDWVGFDIMSNGNETQDFAISIDFAKRLCMLARTDEGEKIRSYFIACEKRLQEVAKPLSQLEILAQSAQILLEQDKRIATVEEKVKEIEARTQTRPEYFTVVGYGSLSGISVNLQLAARMGKRASVICKQQGIQTDEIPDPRFGKVRMYPKKVLEEVFSEPIWLPAIRRARLLGEIYKEKELVEQEEARCAVPLSEPSLLPAMYRLYLAFIGKKKLEPIEKKVFLFVALSICSPKSLAGKKLPAGLRVALCSTLGFNHGSSISHGLNDALTLYDSNVAFRDKVEQAYSYIMDNLGLASCMLW